MTLAWLQLSYRQTEAYSFSTETAVAFITAKIVDSAIGTKAFCACAALESLLWVVTFWPICNESLIEICCGQHSILVLIRAEACHVSSTCSLPDHFGPMEATVSITVIKGVFVRYVWACCLAVRSLCPSRLIVTACVVDHCRHVCARICARMASHLS